MTQGRSDPFSRAPTANLSRRCVLQGGLGLAGAGLLATAPFGAAWAADGFLEITAGPSKYKLYRDDSQTSDLWTYNDTLPGPEIRARRGERIKVRLINNLEEPSSVHWHGIRIDNAMDGVSGLTQDPVQPGDTFEYDFAVPDAGTYWYHAHNKSWNQVGRGLYGPLIIDEEQRTFDTEHDLTLMADDWRLNEDGALDTASFGSLMDWSHAGRLGNWLTVNGRSNPNFDLKAGDTYRLRILNVSNARILEIDPARLGGELLGFDGQVFAKPVTPDRGALTLGPAQRVDLLVSPRAGQTPALVEISTRETFVFARFTVVGDDAPTPSPVLPQPNQLPEPDLRNARTVKLDMTGGAMGRMSEMRHKGRVLTREDIRETGQVWAFNGVAGVDSDPLFHAARGDTILLETINNTAWRHAIHTHGHHFRIVGSDGTLGPWRDTFLIDRDESVRIALLADNPGKWLLHCHMLEHAAAGMTTWFNVA